MTSPMLPRDRCEFSAIVDRPPLRLPGEARLVVWTIVNYEVWDIGRPMARQVLGPPAGVTQLPDVPNWSWHEYGMRVGVWRFFELYKRRGIRPTLAINARVCEDYVRVAEQAKRDGWEFMGHSYQQGPIHQERPHDHLRPPPRRPRRRRRASSRFRRPRPLRSCRSPPAS